MIKYAQNVRVADTQWVLVVVHAIKMKGGSAKIIQMSATVNLKFNTQTLIRKKCA